LAIRNRAQEDDIARQCAAGKSRARLDVSARTDARLKSQGALDLRRIRADALAD
jgi:hypothetical protein